ncbi:hypothetical protein GCM10010349_63780 [Streptomyces flavofungini]|nr:hypothetical protein GCM10010349_63780 [Streptomyces flavofungini]
MPPVYTDEELHGAAHSAADAVAAPGPRTINAPIVATAAMKLVMRLIMPTLLTCGAEGESRPAIGGAATQAKWSGPVKV